MIRPRTPPPRRSRGSSSSRPRALGRLPRRARRRRRSPASRVLERAAFASRPPDADARAGARRRPAPAAPARARVARARVAPRVARARVARARRARARRARRVRPESAAAAERLMPSPERPPHRLCVVGFAAPGDADADATGARFDSVPLANGVICAGAACDLLEYTPQYHADFAEAVGRYARSCAASAAAAARAGVDGAQERFDGLLRALVARGVPVWSSPGAQARFGAYAGALADVDGKGGEARAPPAAAAAARARARVDGRRRALPPRAAAAVGGARTCSTPTPPAGGGAARARRRAGVDAAADASPRGGSSRRSRAAAAGAASARSRRSKLEDDRAAAALGGRLRRAAGRRVGRRGPRLRVRGRRAVRQRARRRRARRRARRRVPRRVRALLPRGPERGRDARRGARRRRRRRRARRDRRRRRRADAARRGGRRPRDDGGDARGRLYAAALDEPGAAALARMEAVRQAADVPQLLTLERAWRTGGAPDDAAAARAPRRRARARGDAVLPSRRGRCSRVRGGAGARRRARGRAREATPFFPPDADVVPASAAERAPAPAPARARARARARRRRSFLPTPSRAPTTRTSAPC